MKTIGIHDFEKIVNERLSNPKAFEGKTLVLWRARCTQESIAYRVIKGCCVKYNQANHENQVWFKCSQDFFTENYTNLKVCCDRKDMYGYKNQGILFNTGKYESKEFEEWTKFINTHENKSGRISENWPLIACAPEDKNHDYNEDLFGDNCEVYNLQPTVEEWAEWIPRYNSELIQAVLNYLNNITKNNLIRNIDYRGEVINNADLYYLERIMNSIQKKMIREHLSLKELNPSNLDIYNAPDILTREVCDFIFK